MRHSSPGRRLVLESCCSTSTYRASAASKSSRRSKDALPDASIVMLTKLADDDLIFDAFRAGTSGYLVNYSARCGSTSSRCRAGKTVYLHRCIHFDAFRSFSKKAGRSAGRASRATHVTCSRSPGEQNVVPGFLLRTRGNP